MFFISLKIFFCEKSSGIETEFRASLAKPNLCNYG